LCGKDPLTAASFEHRRQWIVDRIHLLSEVFAIDVCAYAVMSNHYHVVVHVDRSQALEWNNREVVERWLRLFSGPPFVRRWLDYGQLSDGEYDRLSRLIDTWRQRLHDLSWFMRCLNEPIARMANQEDRCSGRFWEGRFKSQALLDERALMACMAYVDLNPVRAGIAKTPEQSDYTSVHERIHSPGSNKLKPFKDPPNEGTGLPFLFRDYLELVDWAGRYSKSGKKGSIPTSVPPILQRVSMDARAVLDFLLKKPEPQFRALGSLDQLRGMAHSLGMKFFHGVGLARRLWPERIRLAEN
jgi:REP element-mobilizing transposase RayT